MKLDIIEGAPVKSFETSIFNEMDPHLKHYEKELLKIRTGRAHTSLIENIKVDAYGQIMDLKAVASLTAPDAQLLVIQPWDINIIPEIEKALSSSDLGVTPVTDGQIIRIQLPKISSQRRDELNKILHKKAEEARVAIRNVRKEAQNIIRDSQKAKKISQDYEHRLQDSLEKTTQKFIDSVDKLTTKKEEEIKSV
ncbi:ribosome recycling factor [Candidatus Dependentiae bacterium]|nr:ribosome recycling factor [Candidatus Dependentiae bacterium]